MRVSIVNLNLEGRDAIGQCIQNQVRFFQRRGDEVQVYLANAPRNESAGVRSVICVVGPGDITAGKDRRFASSDLYVYHYPGRYPLMDGIKDLERGAVIFYYHNVTPPSLWGSTFDQDVLRDSVANVGRFAGYADWVVTDSQYSADQLIEQYAVERDRIRVLPLAVALDRFRPGSKEAALLRRHSLYGKRVMLFVGRMAGNKRPDLLVEALALVRQRVPNAVLLLVGDDKGNLAIQETVAATRARAADLGVGEAVVFTGMVDDLPDYYRLANVYVSASLHEGFGVPLAEAMASGVPVVASNATAHPWVVGDAGLLAEPGSAVDLADKVTQVLLSDDLCGDLVRRGLLRAQEFSLEHYEEGWARIVADAAAWLPDQPYPRLRSLPAVPGAMSSFGPAAGASGESLRDLETSADVMLRTYVVRSGLPLVGSLIAWIRRNLTSHLREPYLDPSLERQVGFNQRVVAEFRAVLARLAAHEEGLSAQETRMQEVRAQLDLLAAQVSLLELRAAPMADENGVARLKEQIEEIRQRMPTGGAA